MAIIALHHQVHAVVHLGHAKGAGQHAVIAGDAARLARRLQFTPSAVRLMASAGHTSAQVGEWQCIQMTGTVCKRYGDLT